MKTFSEVERWCLGAARQFGDPAIPVGHAFFRHVENILDYRADNDLVFSTDGQEVTLLFAYGNPVVIAVNEDAPEFDGDELVGFGVKHIADGLWALTPSLNMPGLIHLFVTLYDVPRVAPWQKPVLILGGLRGRNYYIQVRKGVAESPEPLSRGRGVRRRSNPRSAHGQCAGL